MKASIILGHCYEPVCVSELRGPEYEEAGREPRLTDEACVDGYVEVVGEGVEDGAVLQLVRLMHDPSHDLQNLLVAQLVPCET